MTGLGSINNGSCDNIMEWQQKRRWYRCIPERFSEREKATLFWDMSLHNDREIKVNRLDRAVRNYLVIDESIPTDDYGSLISQNIKI